METDEDRRQEAKDQEYQAIWGVGRESGQSKAEAINAMMMIITVGSNTVTSSSVAAESQHRQHITRCSKGRATDGRGSGKRTGWRSERARVCDEPEKRGERTGGPGVPRVLTPRRPARETLADWGLHAR
jgi:hypothetical protein